jgi:predicted flavoprotein YhiN
MKKAETIINKMQKDCRKQECKLQTQTSVQEGHYERDYVVQVNGILVQLF